MALAERFLCGGHAAHLTPDSAARILRQAHIDPARTLPVTHGWHGWHGWHGGHAMTLSSMFTLPMLTELHDRPRDKVRQKEGRSPDPTAAIVDSQSVRAAANIPRSTSGWDSGKKVGGRKRYLAVDCLALVLAVAVTAASVQDRGAAVPLLERLRELYFSVRLVWTDGGYTGSLVGWAAEKLRLILEIVKRTDDITGFVVLPRRWVVERTLNWLMRSRRLVRDYETLPAMHEAMVLWSMTMLMSGRPAGRRPGPFSRPVPRKR
ncbi:transposase [Streptomyces sp. 4503]|uniref:Transposase n=2 Tax=Streptomyces niphimycinicus TaxID=2842201 RepID=A0ABS6CJP9_9ACTN|nr:transposase [Streptomyces niphimycinicus]